MVSSSSEHSWAVGEKKCVTDNEYNQKKECLKVKDVDSSQKCSYKINFN